jgi:hypothetical protein
VPSAPTLRRLDPGTGSHACLAAAAIVGHRNRAPRAGFLVRPTPPAGSRAAAVRPVDAVSSKEDASLPRQLAPVLTVLLFAALLALPAPATAASDQVMTFEAPGDLLADDRREATLDEIQAFGVTRIRTLVYWRDFAPRPRGARPPGFDTSDPAAYPAGTWDRLDRLVGSARARGMEIQMTLTGPVPRWGTRARKDQVTSPRPGLFGRWVTAVARRYGIHVDLWSVWNEPNQPQFLLPQYRRGAPASPKLYRRLYVAAERAIHGVPGGQRDRVLMGETSPIGNENIVAPLAFLRGALCLDRSYRRTGRCARLRTDGYAHHAYTKRSGPGYRPPARDSVTIGALDRLVRALNRAANAGVVRKRLGIFLTEFGIQSRPDVISGVPLARQAEYLAIAERIAYANPRVRAFSQYLLRDDAPRRGPRSERYSGFETGLRRHDGRPKPSYRGFLLPLAVTAFRGSDVLWGRVRPARAATTVAIERRTGRRWRRLKTVTTNANGVYGTRARHRRNQRYRVKWTAPDGAVHTGPPIRPY